ncbi:MAG TPA: outer membrane beta-barrel protein, partial [Steroidobacteraceae bacterium]
CGCDYNWWCKLECPDACPQWKMFDDCCCLKEHCTTIEGYLDLGYTANGYGGNNNWNGPVGYNDRADEFQMNQAYIAIEKATKSEDCDWDLGGRMDLLYGTDARWIESTGLEKSTSGHEKWVSDERFYHLAMVQAYAELAKGDWKFKFGKFNGLLGYEVIDSRGNFFYSHSYSYLYAVPTTNTGFMATKTVNENVSYSLGVVSGWDDFFDNQGNVDFLGDISWTSCDKNTNLVFGLISGDERNAFGNETNRTAYSVVWTQKINDRLSNVVEHDLGVQQNGNAAQNANATWYTLSDYLTYQLSCDWWLAGRVEWFQDTNGTRVAAIGDTETTNAFPGSNPASAGGFAGNFYEYTVGLNYKPQSNQNLIVRPELRWDNYNGVGNPFDNGTRQTQFLFAIDALLKF